MGAEGVCTQQTRRVLTSTILNRGRCCVTHPLSKRSSLQISSPCFLHEHWTFYQQLSTGKRTPKCVCNTYCTIFADSWNHYFPTALHHTLFLLPSLPLSLPPSLPLPPSLIHSAWKNGWQVISPKKSFAVFAATPTEKAEWMAHINKCIVDLLAKSEFSTARVTSHLSCMLCTVPQNALK